MLGIAVVIAVMVGLMVYALCAASGRESRREEKRFPPVMANRDGTTRPTVIAVDFDGCLFGAAWPSIGTPNWELVARLKEFQALGGKVILWTCREGVKLYEALRECEMCGLRFDAVNANLDSWKAAFGNDPRKVGADYYIDDKAVRVAADE